MSLGRYMAYSPSPSAPQSPHIGGSVGAGGGIRAAYALAEQEQYLAAELLAKRNKLNPFIAVLPNCYRLLKQEQSGLEHASPLASGGIYSNAGANVNRWASPFQSEVDLLNLFLPGEY